MEKKIRFNGMDLFIVIVLVAVIAAGVYFIMGRGSATASNEKVVDVKYVVEITAKNVGYEDAIKVGDVVMVGEKDKMRTTVEKVEVLPAKTTGYDILNGRVIRADVPEDNDIQITLCGVGEETDRDIKINDVAVRVGQEVAMFGNGWSSTGYVIRLDSTAR